MKIINIYTVLGAASRTTDRVWGQRARVAAGVAMITTWIRRIVVRIYYGNMVFPPNTQYFIIIVNLFCWVMGGVRANDSAKSYFIGLD